MSLSNLYFRGCFEQPSDEQKLAVDGAGSEGDVVDRSCARESVNTCGISIKTLFDTYPIYDPQKGLYKSWGDIEFPWEISSLTPNLLISSTDDKWSIASYRALVAYKEGTKVLVIENDGYRVSLYEANEDIAAISKAFDSSKWTKICHVETTEPAGIPTIAELKARYKPYKLEPFDKTWSSYSDNWSEPNFKDEYAACLESQGENTDSLEQCLNAGTSLSQITDDIWYSSDFQETLKTCIDNNLKISDLEDCMLLKSSDRWHESRIKRQFFYRQGDIVLVEGECGDALCVYIATQDIPVTKETLVSQSSFDPKSSLWQRIYCVPTGRNKCLEYQRKKEPELGYDVVEIGSEGHFVEMPVPYRLRPTTASLDERAEIQTPPRILTQAEINALSQPQEE